MATKAQLRGIKPTVSVFDPAKKILPELRKCVMAPIKNAKETVLAVFRILVSTGT